MKHTIMTSAAAALGLALTLASATMSWSQSPTAHMGTLTCVLSPASEEPFGTERELSCDFQPLMGPKADLRGVVKRLGASVPDQQQSAMIWTVFGPSLDTPAGHLEGRYVGSLGSESEDGLIGGMESSIRLKPLTAAPEFGNAALSVLELELTAMKA